MPASANLGRVLSPGGLERAFSSRATPAIVQVARVADQVADGCTRAAADNRFLADFALWLRRVEQTRKLMRDTRDVVFDLGFASNCSTRRARVFGRMQDARCRLKTTDELRGLPEVTAALADIEFGGFAEAGICMLVLVAANRSIQRPGLVLVLRPGTVIRNPAPVAAHSKRAGPATCQWRANR